MLRLICCGCHRGSMASLYRVLSAAAAAMLLMDNIKLLAEAQAQQSSRNSNASSVLFSPGFSFSMMPPPANVVSSFNSVESQKIQEFVGMPNLDDGLFIPILSSPSFHSSAQTTRGFSLGFYLWCRSRVGGQCSLYLAVCAGSWGYGSGTTERSSPRRLHFPVSALLEIFVTPSDGGSAVPLWFANRDHPINNIPSASLVVAQNTTAANNTDGKGEPTAQNHPGTNTSMELQLKDGDEVVWNVRNVGQMEIHDSGDFLIRSPTNATVFEWRSKNTTDTLVEGQNLLAGMELRSNDSAYSARMEVGGLAFYLNSMEPRPPPYWILPLLRDPDPSRPNPTVMQLLNSSTPDINCTDMSHPRYLHIVSAIPDKRVNFYVSEPGSCSSRFSSYYYFFVDIDPIPEFNLSWSFLRLEGDGRLYIYAVSIHPSFGFRRYALDSNDIKVQIVRDGDRPYSPMNVHATSIVNVMQDQVAKCDVPLACGPLGLCSPGAITVCQCPDDQSRSFVPIDTSDLNQGCKPLTDLPPCSSSSDELIHSTDHHTFVELKATASVFMLNGWTFDSTTDADACKRSCSSDCHCLGVSYQGSTGSCFLIAVNMTLLAVSNASITSWNYTATHSEDPFFLRKRISAADYVTYLKVAPRPDSFNSPSPPTPTGFSILNLVGIIPTCVALCIFLGLGAYYVKKRRREQLQQARDEEELRDIMSLMPTRFSYKELKDATKGFARLLGEGGCGSVYAGTLKDGRNVAVKVLQGVLQGAHQSRDFLAEVATVGRTGHQHIVRLVGFCWQASHRILVYEYMEGGSLDSWLFGGVEKGVLLNWQRRYNIALGVARGLHYLHEECEESILHADIKPQNILLNEAFVAKLADFGMSRLMQRDMSLLMTGGVRGTPGYIAPEWLSHGTVSKRCDMYSMGIVMLEIVSGRKVLDYSKLRQSSADADPVEREEWHLLSWVARKWDEGSVMDIVDPRLQVCGFDEAQVQRLLYIALWCSHQDPAVRPTATTIVQWLESSVSIGLPPAVTSSKLSVPVFAPSCSGSTHVSSD